MKSASSAKNRYRNALLAQVHIARKELGIEEEDYRAMLREEFGPATAADLSVQELEQLVERFISKGWKGRASNLKPPTSNRPDQAAALKERIGQVLLPTDFDEKRLRGLVRRICGVDDLRFVKDPVPLRRLLAVIGSMMDKGTIRIEHSAKSIAQGPQTD